MIRQYIGFLATLAAVSLITSGCGIEPESEHFGLSAVDVEDRTPVVLTFGGWNTCKRGSNGKRDPVGSSIWRPSLTYRQQIQDLYGKEPLWVTSCYTYYKARESGKARYLSHNNPTSYRRASPQETIALVRGMVDSVANADVYVVGYSYGGWMAMKVVERIGSHIRVPMLATLDAISQKECNMMRFASSYLFGGSRGCKRFPRDIGNHSLKVIEQQTMSWRNYYQLDYSRLHSGPSPYADVQRQVKTRYRSHKAHNHLVNAADIWLDLGDILDGRKAETGLVYMD